MGVLFQLRVFFFSLFFYIFKATISATAFPEFLFSVFTLNLNWTGRFPISRRIVVRISEGLLSVLVLHSSQFVLVLHPFSIEMLILVRIVLAAGQ